MIDSKTILLCTSCFVPYFCMDQMQQGAVNEISVPLSIEGKFESGLSLDKPSADLNKILLCLKTQGFMEVLDLGSFKKEVNKTDFNLILSRIKPFSKKYIVLSPISKHINLLDEEKSSEMTQIARELSQEVLFIVKRALDYSDRLIGSQLAAANSLAADARGYKEKYGITGSEAVPNSGDVFNVTQEEFAQIIERDILGEKFIRNLKKLLSTGSMPHMQKKEVRDLVDGFRELFQFGAISNILDSIIVPFYDGSSISSRGNAPILSRRMIEHFLLKRLSLANYAVISHNKMTKLKLLDSRGNTPTLDVEFEHRLGRERVIIGDDPSMWKQVGIFSYYLLKNNKHDTDIFLFVMKPHHIDLLTSTEEHHDYIWTEYLKGLSDKVRENPDFISELKDEDIYCNDKRST